DVAPRPRGGTLVVGAEKALRDDGFVSAFDGTGELVRRRPFGGGFIAAQRCALAKERVLVGVSEARGDGWWDLTVEALGAPDGERAWREVLPGMLLHSLVGLDDGGALLLARPRGEPWQVIRLAAGGGVAWRRELPTRVL